MEILEINKLLRDVYRGRRVLVTGHTGFKGAWLVRCLLHLGAEITGYALAPPSTPNMFDALHMGHDVHHIHGDIRNFDSFLTAFTETRPEVVFHLAAQPLVRQSYYDPVDTYASNVMGTVHLLECLRKSHDTRALVNVTSDKCYENREWLWGYREDEAMGGHDPYSSSKGCAELVTSAYRQSFFKPEAWGISHCVALASARSGNVIGGGDWGKDRLMPDCVAALSARREIVLRNPGAVRPWQHVRESLRGYLLLGARLYQEGTKFSGAWNFGPADTETWTVEDTVKRFCACWGEGSYRVESASLHEASWLKLDSAKSRQLLGWTNCLSTAEAIELTVAWFKSYVDGADARVLRDLTDAQIDLTK